LTVAESSRDTRPLPDDVLSALRQGNKIDAIKRLRQAWAIDLKEAKDHVDRHIDNDPELHRKIHAMSVSGARGCLFWLMLLLFIGYGAYELFARR